MHIYFFSIYPKIGCPWKWFKERDKKKKKDRVMASFFYSQKSHPAEFKLTDFFRIGLSTRRKNKWTKAWPNGWRIESIHVYSIHVPSLWTVVPIEFTPKLFQPLYLADLHSITIFEAPSPNLLQHFFSRQTLTLCTMAFDQHNLPQPYAQLAQNANTIWCFLNSDNFLPFCCFFILLYIFFLFPFSFFLLLFFFLPTQVSYLIIALELPNRSLITLGKL